MTPVTINTLLLPQGFRSEGELPRKQICSSNSRANKESTYSTVRGAARNRYSRLMMTFSIVRARK